MSYTKYCTPGIVIGGSNIGEASRFFNIFTRDFGLLRVRAQGIRELKSKLKYNLQNLFLLEAHLIRGKNGWMITEAYKKKSFSDLGDRSKTQALTRTLLLLKRMVSGEERLDEIFDIIHEGFDFLEKQELSKEEIKDLEALIVLRLLRGLGYIKNKEKIEKFLVTTNFDRGILERLKPLRPKMVKEINLSLKASGL